MVVEVWLSEARLFQHEQLAFRNRLAFQLIKSRYHLKSVHQHGISRSYNMMQSGEIPNQKYPVFNRKIMGFVLDSQFHIYLAAHIAASVLMGR